MPDNEHETGEMIDLTPNYPALFQTFKDQIPHAVERSLKDASETDGDRERKAEHLETLNNLLYTIAMALNSMTRLLQIYELREVVYDALTKVNEAHRAAQDADEKPEEASEWEPSGWTVQQRNGYEQALRLRGFYAPRGTREATKEYLEREVYAQEKLRDYAQALVGDAIQELESRGDTVPYALREVQGVLEGA